VAIGGLAIGLVAAGLHGAVAMLGVGGVGRGFVLPLLPSLGRRLSPSDPVRMAAIRGGAEGWVRLHLEPRPDGRIAVYEEGERVRDVRLDARVRRAAAAVVPADVWARLRPSRDGWVAERLFHLEPPRWVEPRWWLVWGAQLAGLTLLAAAVWGLVVRPLLAAWFGPDGVLVP
jgi:hypothetical protein